MDTQQALKEFVGAKVYLGIRLPFFGSLFSHLRVFFTDDPAIPTAGVTADDRVFININFFHSLTVRQRAFLLAHEVLHPALGYFLRSRGFHPKLANIAHDFIINLILVEEEKEWFIPGGCLDEKYKGWTFEEIYAELVKKAQGQASAQGVSGQGGGKGKKGKGGGNPSSAGDQPGAGDPIGKDTLTKEEADQISGVEVTPVNPDAGRTPVDAEASARKWTNRVIEAALTARAQGRGSAGIDRLVGLASDATVPWHEILRLAINDAFVRSRTDWNYPSRRSDALGFYAPREEYLGFEAAVYVDSSGSISPQNLEVACAETQSIIDNAGGQIRWMEGDDGVLDDKWIGSAPESIKGGGGTSFVPVFEHLRDNPPKLLVIFTDTWGTMPDFSPDYPVIWAVFKAPGQDLSSIKIPFGEMIEVPDSIGRAAKAA